MTRATSPAGAEPASEVACGHLQQRVDGDRWCQAVLVLLDKAVLHAKFRVARSPRERTTSPVGYAIERWAERRSCNRRRALHRSTHPSAVSPQRKWIIPSADNRQFLGIRHERE